MPGSLLTEVLRLLKEGGIYSTAELARRLDTREALVAAMAEDLAHHGYLESIGGDCSTACDGCALSGVCATPGQPGTATQAFALTAKSRRAVT